MAQIFHLKSVHSISNYIKDYQVDDPLALLLEVEVGGGTDIAGAMRVARSRIKIPDRTLCALV